MNEYIDLGERLPQYECSGCGWFHGEDEAWGMGHDSDRFTCPKCNTLITHSKEVRNPDHSKGLTGFQRRRVRL